MTQPALSVRVQELEAELRIALIERRRGQVGLTRVGEEVARRAAAILMSVRELHDYAISAAGLLTGPLSLGVIPTVAPYLLARMLPFVRDAFPGLELTILEAQTGKLMEEITSGGLDAVLVSIPVEPPRLTQMPLFDDGFVLAVCAGSDLAKQEFVDQEGLAGIDLLLLDEGHCLRDQALSFCNIAPRRIRDRYGAASLSTIMQFIANGQGATFLPEIAVPVEMRGNRQVVLRRFAGIQPYRTLGLVWRETSPRSEDFHRLGQMIAEVGWAIVAEGRQLFGNPEQRSIADS